MTVMTPGVVSEIHRWGPGIHPMRVEDGDAP